MRVMLLPTSKLGAALNEFIQQTSWVEYVTFGWLQFRECGGQDLSEIAPLAQLALQHRLQQQQRNFMPTSLWQLMNKYSPQITAN
jgi:hypothetical protein